MRRQAGPDLRGGLPTVPGAARAAPRGRLGPRRARGRLGRAVATGLWDAGAAGLGACGRDLPRLRGVIRGRLGADGAERTGVSGVWGVGPSDMLWAQDGVALAERGSAAVCGPGWGSGA